MSHADIAVERVLEGQNPKKTNDNENHSHLDQSAQKGYNPKSLANLTARGRPPGVQNKVTRTIRQAVMESIEPGNCHPEGLAGWLIDRARGGIEDKKIYAAVVSRVIPIEITGEGGGPVKIDLGWLTSRKVGGEVIDITPTTQIGGEQADMRLSTDYQSEAPVIAEGVDGQAAAAEVAKGKRGRTQKAQP